MARISVTYEGRTLQVDMGRWMFAEQRALSKWTGWTREEWAAQFGTQDPQAVAFFVWVALARNGDAPALDTADDFAAWWQADTFDLDLASVVVMPDESAAEDSEVDESHLPTISAGA